MTVESFYEKQNYPKLDKHDKKAEKFTYYDMCEFSKEYHKSKLKKKDMKKTELEVTKILENDTLDSTENKYERFETYKQWVLSLNKESLKGVIVGCATFRLKTSNSRLFSATKEDRMKAKFKIDISNIYLDFAKDVFYCL